VAYLVLLILGLWYGFWYYDSLGITFFYYVDVQDFLLLGLYQLGGLQDALNNSFNIILPIMVLGLVIHFIPLIGLHIRRLYLKLILYINKEKWNKVNEKGGALKVAERALDKKLKDLKKGNAQAIGRTFKKIISWEILGSAMLFLVAAFVFLQAIDDAYVIRDYKNNSQSLLWVKVTVLQGKYGMPADLLKRAILIGKTNSFVFLYLTKENDENEGQTDEEQAQRKKSKGRVFIVPTANLASLEYIDPSDG